MHSTSARARAPRRPPMAALSLLGVAALATGLAACSPGPGSPGASATSPTGGPAVTAGAWSPPAARRVSPADFLAAASQPGTVVLDVRTPEEFAADHLHGAVNLDIEGPDFARRIALDHAATYAVYSRSGNRSATAVEAMARAGFERAFDVDGGIGALRQAGHSGR